jgi:hypothetical protein
MLRFDNESYLHFLDVRIYLSEKRIKTIEGNSFYYKKSNFEFEFLHPDYRRLGWFGNFNNQSEGTLVQTYEHSSHIVTPLFQYTEYLKRWQGRCLKKDIHLARDTKASGKYALDFN